jgi:Na+/melibiose symporter-like transporter
MSPLVLLADVSLKVTICIMAAMVLTILFVTKFGSRFEKRTLFNFGAILSALTYVGFYFCPGTAAALI